MNFNFGKTSTEYDINQLQALLKDGKATEAGNYILSYFIKIDNDKFVLMWKNKQLIAMTYDICKSIYIKKRESSVYAT